MDKVEEALANAAKKMSEEVSGNNHTKKEITKAELARLFLISEKDYGQFLMRTGKDKQNRLRNKLLKKQRSK